MAPHREHCEQCGKKMVIEGLSNTGRPKRICSECRYANAKKQEKARAERLSSMPEQQRPMCKCGRGVIVAPKWYCCTHCTKDRGYAAGSARLGDYDKVTNTCQECGKPVLAKQKARCADCSAKHKAAMKIRHTAKNRIARLALNEEYLAKGQKICARCLSVKDVTAFGKRSQYSTELNDTCDLCLSSIYEIKNKGKEDFGAAFWRKLAYSANTSAVARLRRKDSSVTIQNLSHKCEGVDMAALWSKQEGRCHYCGDVLTVTNISVDHSVPISKDGGHTPDNLTLVCNLCQRVKWDLTESDFITLLHAYADRVVNLRSLESSDKEPVS